LAFIRRIYHDAPSSDCQTEFYFYSHIEKVFAAKDALPAVINAVHYVHFLVRVWRY